MIDTIQILYREKAERFFRRYSVELLQIISFFISELSMEFPLRLTSLYSNSYPRISPLTPLNVRGSQVTFIVDSVLLNDALILGVVSLGADESIPKIEV